MNEFKKLLGESISDETAEALQQILDSKILTLSESKTDLEEQIQSLTEQIDVLNKEINTKDEEIALITEKADEYLDQVKDELTESLIEKAEEYAEKVRQETIEEMTEKANAYGEFLMEQADAYGTYLQEQAELYAEQEADKYGDFLQEQAEKYGVFLISEADTYAKSVEEKCLAESAQQIEEFKKEHVELFEQVDEYNRMKQVFGNLKALVESSGFSIDEDSQIEKMNEQLRQEKATIRKLKRELSESAEIVKEHQIKSIIEESNVELSMLDKERIVAKAKNVVAESVDELKDAVKLLIENVETKQIQEKQEKQTKQLNESKDVTSPVSKWAEQLL